MVNVTIKESSDGSGDDLSRGFSYTANVQCPIATCSEHIKLKKLLTKSRCGNVLQPKWIYSNFRRHITSVHLDAKNKGSKTSASTSKTDETQHRTQPTILQYVTKDLPKPSDFSIEEKRDSPIELETISDEDDDRMDKRCLQRKRKAHVVNEDPDDIDDSGEW